MIYYARSQLGLRFFTFLVNHSHASQCSVLLHPLYNSSAILNCLIFFSCLKSRESSFPCLSPTCSFLLSFSAYSLIRSLTTLSNGSSSYHHFLLSSYLSFHPPPCMTVFSKFTTPQTHVVACNEKVYSFIKPAQAKLRKGPN